MAHAPPAPRSQPRERVGLRPMQRRRRIAVVGAANATPAELAAARAVGEALARHGAILVCGGLGGVMAAAADGARAADGLTVGILPTYDPDSADASIAIPIPTGLGQARNVVVVAAADAVIAIGGGAGTLSEIALALKLGRPVIGLGTWRLAAPDGARLDLTGAHSPAEAVRLALDIRSPTP